MVDLEEVRRLLDKPTASVPDVGMKIFGLSRNGSYEAAKRGEIATIRFGKRLVAITAPIRRQLGLDDDKTFQGSVSRETSRE